MTACSYLSTSSSLVLLSLLLLLSLFPLPSSSTFFTPLCNSTATEPCDSPTSAPWNRRSEHFTFYWYGAVWIAGGLDVQTITTSGPRRTVYFQDAWGSYDLGRQWIAANASLPSPCTSSTAQATLYAGAVFLTCDDGMDTNHTTAYTSSPTLSYWQTAAPLGTDDGLGFRQGMSVNRMAVPYDGVGTLVLLGGNVGLDMNDVWTLSATGEFDGSPTYRWNQFQDKISGQPYLAPWIYRTQHMTAVDSEGLVLIVMGGGDYELCHLQRRRAKRRVADELD